MKTVSFTSLILLITMVNAVGAQDLSAHRWENRILLLYSDDTDSQAYQDQLTIWANQKTELLERKLVIYQIHDRFYREGWQTDGPWQLMENKRFPAAIDASFEVVLMGLDGGIKLRQQEVLTAEKLFGIIDSMPMRQWEMRNKR